MNQDRAIRLIERVLQGYSIQEAVKEATALSESESAKELEDLDEMTDDILKDKR